MKTWFITGISSGFGRLMTEKLLAPASVSPTHFGTSWPPMASRRNAATGCGSPL
ncbi:hypothetical protein [Streptomyces sp. BH105]